MEGDSMEEDSLNDIDANTRPAKNLKRTGKAGILAASLELTKEGNLVIKQDKLFDDIFVRKNS